MSKLVAMQIISALGTLDFNKELELKAFDDRPDQKPFWVISNTLSRGHKMTAIDQLERLKGVCDHLKLNGFKVVTTVEGAVGSYPNVQTARPDRRRAGEWTPWNQVVIYPDNLPDSVTAEARTQSKGDDKRIDKLEQMMLRLGTALGVTLDEEPAPVEQTQVAPVGADDDIPF